MQDESTLYYKIVTQRLEPIPGILYLIGQYVICIALIPLSIIYAVFKAIRQLRHSREEALEALIGIPAVACITAFGGIGIGLWTLFETLIFGAPD